MCGISGFLSAPGRITEAESLSILRKMTDAISHRGPDSDGFWTDSGAGVGLGHRRLSIIDLSPAGSQPMISENGRYVIIFNGEIYNYRALRQKLESTGAAPCWRGHSDTEVMLAAISAWGLQSSLEQFNGMFALALWDRQDRQLYLARDRAGEKPLYFGWQNNSFLFGSELKALAAHPNWKPEINRDALALYLRYGYVPAPFSIFSGINKLSPGTFLQLPANLPPGRIPEASSYWSARMKAEISGAAPSDLSDHDVVKELDDQLRQAVALRMEADVPLGAFLSGGIDSSTIVALMQAQSPRPVKTFTIGFHEKGYNEADHAKAVALHLGTDHTELYVTSQEAMGVIPKLPHLYDEPFADSSQIPTYLVAHLARQHVTVSLSGDAGDELFGGYNRYFQLRTLWSKTHKIPRPVRAVAAKALASVSPGAWDVVAEKLIPSRLRPPAFGDKIHKVAKVFAKADPDQMYLDLVSQWTKPEDIVINSAPLLTALTDPSQRPLITDHTTRMMYSDFVSYLPDDILTKVDRATMGISLESRIPLLDPAIIEFAWNLPLHQKIRNGVGKWALRQVLYKYVPSSLLDRPKMGFGVPLHEWLRGPLRPWAEELLREDRLRSEGYFHPGEIRKKWQEHLSGTQNWQDHLWTILMFQTWLESIRR